MGYLGRVHLPLFVSTWAPLFCSTLERRVFSQFFSLQLSWVHYFFMASPEGFHYWWLKRHIKGIKISTTVEISIINHFKPLWHFVYIEGMAACSGALPHYLLPPNSRPCQFSSIHYGRLPLAPFHRSENDAFYNSNFKSKLYSSLAMPS